MKIHSKTGPASFTVVLTDGRVVKRHLDQLRKDSANHDTGPASMADYNDNALPQCLISVHLQMISLKN